MNLLIKKVEDSIKFAAKKSNGKPGFSTITVTRFSDQAEIEAAPRKISRKLDDFRLVNSSIRESVEIGPTQDKQYGTDIEMLSMCDSFNVFMFKLV